MRDYRSVPAIEFVAESIEMKMRWLARRLRWTDSTEEIGQWVKVIASLNELLEKLKLDVSSYRKRTFNHQSKPTPMRKSYIISEPCTVDCKCNDTGSENRKIPRTVGDLRSEEMEVEVVEKIPKPLQRTDGDLISVEMEVEVEDKKLMLGTQALTNEDLAEVMKRDLEAKSITSKKESRMKNGKKRWRKYMTQRLRAEGKSYEDYKSNNCIILIENIIKDMGCEETPPFPMTLIDFISRELYKYFYPTEGI